MVPGAACLSCIRHQPSFLILLPSVLPLGARTATVGLRCSPPAAPLDVRCTRTDSRSSVAPPNCMHAVTLLACSALYPIEPAFHHCIPPLHSTWPGYRSLERSAFLDTFRWHCRGAACVVQWGCICGGGWDMPLDRRSCKTPLFRLTGYANGKLIGENGCYQRAGKQTAKRGRSFGHACEVTYMALDALLGGRATRRASGSTT